MAEWPSLKKFLTLFGISSASSTQPAALESETPPKDHGLESSDRITRFVTERDHYKPSKPENDRLSFRVFIPSKKDADELSTADTEALPETAVWQLADEMITAESGRPVIARGDLTVGQVAALAVTGYGSLTVKRDEPPNRHTLIVGWPPLTEGDARKSLAQQLRKAAKPVGR